MSRARPIQIYLKLGVEKDERLLAIWDACKRHDRPQEVFRQILYVGLDAMIKSGQISENILDAVENFEIEKSESSVLPEIDRLVERERNVEDEPTARMAIPEQSAPEPSVGETEEEDSSYLINLEHAEAPSEEPAPMVDPEPEPEPVLEPPSAPEPVERQTPDQVPRNEDQSVRPAAGKLKLKGLM